MDSSSIDLLLRWLDRINAVELLVLESPSRSMRYFVYGVNGSAIVVEYIYSGNGVILGWDMYVPPAKGTNAETMIERAAALLDVPGTWGLE